MARSGRFEELERERKQPMREILREQFQKHTSQAQIAAELGVSQSTISEWIDRVRGRVRLVLEFEGELPIGCS